MAIVHVVLFEFSQNVTTEQIQDTCNRMLGLSEKCVRPTTNKPYIISAVGGKDNSPEGLTGGLTHGFLMSFENEEDRDYYVHKDPAHQDFVKSLHGVIQSARVIDFQPGVF